MVIPISLPGDLIIHEVSVDHPLLFNLLCQILNLLIIVCLLPYFLDISLLLHVLVFQVLNLILHLFNFFLYLLDLSYQRNLDVNVICNCRDVVFQLLFFGLLLPDLLLHLL